MNHNLLRRGSALVLLLVLLASLLPAALGADGGNLYITGYQVSKSTITKGDTVDITVSIKDTGDGTGAGDPASLDIGKLEDSFTGGTVTVTKTSAEQKPLSYEIKFAGVKYKGVGQSLKFQIGTAGAPDSYQSMELTITEAVVYEAPQHTDKEPQEAAPAPMVLVSRSEIKKPIEAGQELEITVSFQNLGAMKLRSPVATFTPSDALEIVGGASSFALDDIAPKKTASVKVKIKAGSTIPSANQSLGVELKFNYNNNQGYVQGNVTDKVSIPALGRESVPQPVVLVTRSQIAKPLAAEEEAEVTIQFRNAGTTKLVDPVVSVTPSESLLLLNDSATFLLSAIEPGKSASVVVKVKAAKGLNATSQSLSTDLKYSYDNGGMLTQATSSDKLVIPTVAKESVAQPVVVVTRSGLSKPLSANETANVTLTFRNAGTAKLVSPVASVTPSEALILLNDSGTFLLPDIGPGESASLALRVQAGKELTAATQSLSTELKYSYDNGETITQATASDRINLSVNPTAAAGEKSDASVPNIIISSFSYGGSSVAAGSSFPLNFTFENTGVLNIENVVVTVDGGENFTMEGSTNTFHYKKLPAGNNLSQEVPMRAVPTGKSGAQSIGISFKYEYLDGDKRTQSNSEIKLSIPFYQPDRFQITAPTVPETVNVGEETEIMLAYFNKGKDDLANLEATVEGNGVDTPARVQYLGNVTAGTSGNIGFALTPNKEGEISVVLKVSYENADQQVQTREFPIKFRALDYTPSEEFPEDDMETQQEPSFPWIPVGVGGAVVAALVVVFLLRRRKAMKDQLPAADWDDNWEENEQNNGEG